MGDQQATRPQVKEWCITRDPHLASLHAQIGLEVRNTPPGGAESVALMARAARRLNRVGSDCLDPLRS